MFESDEAPRVIKLKSKMAHLQQVPASAKHATTVVVVLLRRENGSAQLQCDAASTPGVSIAACALDAAGAAEAAGGTCVAHAAQTDISELSETRHFDVEYREKQAQFSKERPYMRDDGSRARCSAQYVCGGEQSRDDFTIHDADSSGDANFGAQGDTCVMRGGDVSGVCGASDPTELVNTPGVVGADDATEVSVAAGTAGVVAVVGVTDAAGMVGVAGVAGPANATQQRLRHSAVFV